MQTIDFEQLVKQYRKTKDPKLFQQLYEASYQPVYRYIYSLGRDQKQTEEALQNGYIVCYEKLNQLAEGAKFVPWLKTICYHEYLALVKQQNKTLSTDLQDEDGDDQENNALVDANVMRMPEEAVAQKELKKILLTAINDLPDGQRIAVMRFYYDNASIQMIARELDVPENTIKSYLSRGRKTMGKKIGAYANAYGLRLAPIATVPFLASLFKTEVEASGLTATGEMVRASYAAFVSAETGRQAAMSASSAAKSAAAKAASNAAKAAAKGTAKSAAGTGTKSLVTKFVAGVTAVVVTSGGAAVLWHQNEKKDPYQPYKELMEAIPEGTSGDGKRIFYRLYDLDQNGVLELFVTNEEEVHSYPNPSGQEVWDSTVWSAYTIQDQELKELGSFGGLRVNNDILTQYSPILEDFESYAKTPVLVKDHENGYTEYLYHNDALEKTYEMVYPSQEGASNGQILDPSGNTVLTLNTEYLRSNGYVKFSAIDQDNYTELINVFEYHYQEFLDYLNWKTKGSGNPSQTENKEE